jgi:5-hydroxyisourate hydrolase-like protein (transthyretin family)
VRTILQLALFAAVISRGLCFEAEPGGSVSGVVLDAATGAPIPNAIASLCAYGLHDSEIAICREVKADQQGRFLFSRQKAGRYYLSFQAEGYLKDSLRNTGRGGSNFVVHDGGTFSARMTLWPAATITGRLVDETGQPIEGLSVSAVQRSTSLGRRFVRRYQYRGDSSDAVTGADGVFYLADLKPGAYFLLATFDAVRSPAAIVEEKGYVPAYYPHGDTLEEAQPLCIAPGEKRSVDFQLHPRPTRAVRFHLGLPDGFKVMSGPLIGLQDSRGNFVGIHIRDDFDEKSHLLTLSSLPPGAYSLQVSTGLYKTDYEGSISFVVHSDDQQDFDLPMNLPLELSAHVQNPPEFRSSRKKLWLFDMEPDGNVQLQDAGQEPDSNGSLVFGGLYPGHLKLYLRTDDYVYLRSAQLGAQDVLAHGIELSGPEKETLKLVLARATGEVSGHVNGADGKAVSSADVKLLVQGDDIPYVFRSTPASADGSFHFAGIPPGKYQLAALTDAVRDWEVEEWQLDLLFDHGQEIEVADQPVAGIKLTAVPLQNSANYCEAFQQR